MSIKGTTQGVAPNDRHQAYVMSSKETGEDKVVEDDVFMYLASSRSSWVSEDPCNREFDMAHSDVVCDLEFTHRDLMMPLGSSDILGWDMVYSSITVVAQVGRLQAHEHGFG